MLRANAFALTTLDTIRRASGTAGVHQSFIVGLRTPCIVRIEFDRVRGTEDLRNVDLHRTPVAAVTTGSTADQRNIQIRTGHGLDQFLLLRAQRLEMGKGLQVIRHLLIAGHTGKNGHDPGQRRGETKRPGSDRIIRTSRLVSGLEFFRQRCQRTAFDRLHYDHRDAAAFQDLVQIAGADDGILPVQIIQLDLNELNFRMFVQYLDEQIRPAVIGKSEMFDLSFRLFLQAPGKAVIFLVGVDVAFFDRMQKIEIEVVNTGTIQLLFISQAGSLLAR